MFSGPARDRPASPGGVVVAARLSLDGALDLAPGALLHRHRDPSGRDGGPARLHRPRHGRGRRRDRGDRRRVHDLPGRHARRHVAHQGRQAPSDARPRRHRRRQLAGDRRLHGGRWRAHRFRRGRRQAGAGRRDGGRQPGQRHPGRRRRDTRGDRREDGLLGLRPDAGRRPGVAGDEGADRQRFRPRAPDRAALAGDREALVANARAAERGLRSRRSAHHRELRRGAAQPAGDETTARRRERQGEGGFLSADLGRNAAQSVASVSR